MLAAIPRHAPVPMFYMNEECGKKMFTVKLMRKGQIHLYYAERVVINKPDDDERSIWMKWVETGEEGGSVLYEDTVWIDGEHFDFAVVEQQGKTVEVVRTREADTGRDSVRPRR